jgi:hypothetical protein
MKALLALAAAALTILALAAAAGAATGRTPDGRWGARPDPRFWVVAHPAPRTFRLVAPTPIRWNARTLRAAIGRW